MAPKFKVGDTVKKIGISCRSAMPGGTYTVTSDAEGLVICSVGVADTKNYGCHCENEWELLEKAIEDNTNTMSIKEKFLLAFKSEPQKSFRKAGITNGDDILTEEGQEIFLTWLLNLNADAFKKEVIDPILAEEQAAK